MKRCISQRILSALLAMVLLLSSCPMAYAAETVSVEETIAAVAETEAPETVAAETEDIQTEAAEETTLMPEETQTEAVTEPPVETEAAEETESAEETEPVQETESIQETEPAEETDPAEETEPSEETVPTEATLPTEETVPEETEPALLPYGLTGMPEGYEVSEEDAAIKQRMLDDGDLERLKAMTAGKDYVADQVVVMAETEEDAVLMAAAFSGELLSWDYGIAEIRLLTASVPEAVEASLNPEYLLPAAMPNYLAFAVPVEVPASQAQNRQLPELQTWETWVRDTLSNPDPGLLDPVYNENYQWMHDTVGSYAAWGVTTGASWVKVAVIDSGVDTSHNDLRGRVTTLDIGHGTACAGSHGTHVAGIIAGEMNNGDGGAGIAPGVSILSIRACNDSGSYPYTSMGKAIRKAVDSGAHIINMSLGGYGYSDYLQASVDYAVDHGVTIFAAMGNAGTNGMEYPAGLDGVIAVAATDSANNRAYFSSYGAWADIAAPGQGIYSSVLGGYELYNGTSMATPVVAGVAALYMSALGEPVDPATLEKVLESNAAKIKDKGCGAGIVNIANMLDGVPPAPYYVIRDDYQTYSPKDVIPCGAWIEVYENEEAYRLGRSCDENGVFLWSFDGKNPSIKDGQVVHGMVLPEDIGVLYSRANQKVTAKVAYVSGMGVMGKVLSLNLNIGPNDEISSITIRGSKKLIPGKSCTYTAEVAPLESANQAVTWSIYSSTVSGAKIDPKSGKLTTPAGKTGTIKIRATSAVDSSIKSSVFTVTVQNLTPVSKITLNKTSISVFVDATGSIGISRIVDTKGNTVSASNSGVQWTSSNPKVVKVDANGNYEAVGKGNATITCTVLDGSGKKATCKVTVTIPADEIIITGQGSIAPGTAATYKATVNPKDAHNKKVTWSLSGAPYGVSIDAKSGKVTVAKYVATEKSFTVRATAADGSGAYATYTVRTRGKCTSLTIGTDGYSGWADGVQYDAKSWVKAVTLFSTDLDESSAADNQIDLDCYAVSDSDYLSFTFTSSAPHIASVDANGIVTAHKAGTATITLMALDGSNKKASCTVKVTNPVSTISISSSAPRMTTSRYYLGIGKSVKNTAVFANTFGKPTNQKVNWSYRVYQLNSDGSLAYNRTSTFSSKKLITLNASGNLSVKAGAKEYWMDYSRRLMVRVYAEAADGSGASTYIDYHLIPQTTVIIPEGKNWWDYASERGTWFYFWSDQWYGFNASFTATSSNPKVASVMENGVFFDCYDSEMGLNRYKIYLAYSGLRGSTNITITAADGSNKKCSFSLKLY